MIPKNNIIVIFTNLLSIVYTVVKRLNKRLEGIEYLDIYVIYTYLDNF